MSADRPINADVTPPEEGPEPSVEPEAAPEESTREQPRPKPESESKATEVAPAQPRPRRPAPVPWPIKLVAVLVLVAVGFILLAVLGGSGSKKGESAAPTPSTATASTHLAAASGESSSGSEGEGEGESGDSASASAEELGYPSFATSNTTRIGGSDPVSNAAATALAVFPSTNGKQRPVAVAMVDQEDWAGAIAAAVLMAEPVRAPLLYGEPEGVPEATAAALNQLQPHGGAATGGDAVLAIGDVQVPNGLDAAKVAAGDAATEAAGIARLRDRLAGSEPEAIVLASSSEPA